MKITGLSHLFKWVNLHNWWLTKYFFAPLYMVYCKTIRNAANIAHFEKSRSKIRKKSCEVLEGDIQVRPVEQPT